MDLLTVVTATGSAIAAAAALWAATQATRLVGKTQEQVGVAQRQVDLSQRELLGNARPVLMPTASIASGGADGRPYVDLSSATVAVLARVKNVGPGTALNTRLAVFGPSPNPMPSVLPSRRVAWLLPPIASGEEPVFPLLVGASNMNGDACINNEPGLCLFAPAVPSLQQVTYTSAYVMLARLTMTYVDIYGRKHAATWDLDQQQRWHFVAYREDIPQDLEDLEDEALRARMPKP